MKINIKTKDDIDNLLNMLTSTEQTIIVRYNGKFFCGIYYSEEHKSWRFHFDIFNCKDPYSDHVLDLFRYVYDKEFDVFILNSKDELMYEIKDNIIGELMSTFTRDMSLKGHVITEILRNTVGHLGKQVDFNGKHVLLVGVSSTLEDYYYYGITSDGKLVFESCVGGYDVLDQLDRSDRSDHLNDPNLDEIILKLRMEHFPNSEEVELIHI